ncbi:hypothetical protein Shyd_52960 [Streptomyces hydrogenans]|uniref:Uncharacterized protein n=1 Tax=Streptomyces hydrogenans TaxID=1873719 RepID=A0ABQ3PFX0_9ACTN|nr:hypothetical protein GCM10018784_26990 [Streptomyces hydrogenans]GHI23925.1 hypothetical protein Shyd_52960 [Streptomyces hydrogenans]
MRGSPGSGGVGGVGGMAASIPTGNRTATECDPADSPAPSAPPTARSTMQIGMGSQDPGEEAR